MEEQLTPSPDASAFAAIAAQLQCETDEDMAARTIAQRALELVTEALHVSLTISPAEGRYETLASTSHTATSADLLQYELGEGPCLEVAECASWFRSGDVPADPRWPRWGPEAGRLGLRSVLAVRLVTPGQDTHGALNFYSPDVGAFAEPETVDLAQVYAVHAANALSSAHLATGLQTALSSRHTIGLAQGILMERYGLDQHRSFELLRRTSSVHNVKLRDVAAAVVETGVLPGRPT
jgi:ANTAR domain/GAF domain